MVCSRLILACISELLSLGRMHAPGSCKRVQPAQLGPHCRSSLRSGATQKVQPGSLEGGGRWSGKWPPPSALPLIHSQTEAFSVQGALLGAGSDSDSQHSLCPGEASSLRPSGRHTHCRGWARLGQPGDVSTAATEERGKQFGLPGGADRQRSRSGG